jgi:methylated-DNA-[protein]-cysteine S-methyltransferase
MRQGTFTQMRVDSPLGALELTSDGAALCGIHMMDHCPPPAYAAVTAGEDDVLRATAAQLAEYFAGTRRTFDVPLRSDGTEFQRRVWAGLLAIPFGERSSYGALARAIGAGNASRAVGSANRCNPISILVPCHRVVGSDGTLTGYAGGLATKKWLLEHEARVAAATFALRGQAAPVSGAAACR